MTVICKTFLSYCNSDIFRNRNIRIKLLLMWLRIVSVTRNVTRTHSSSSGIRHLLLTVLHKKMLLPTVLYHVFNSVRWRIETRDWLCPVCYWSFLPSFTKNTCSTAWLTRCQTRDQRLLRKTGWEANFIVTLVPFNRWRQEVKVVRIVRFKVENQTRSTVYIKQSL